MMAKAPRPVVIVGFPAAQPVLEKLRECYDVHYAPDKDSRETVAAKLGARVQAVVASGTHGWTEALMDLLPNLKIIAALGAGYENIDLEAARARGIVVTNGQGANTSSVADHAVALLLSIVRGIPQSSSGLRQGEWAKSRGVRPDVAGAKLGILGLGAVGMGIARRLGGFDMEISYFNRRPRDDIPYVYVQSVEELADKVDFLVCAMPGGAATRHLINKPLLSRLGVSGYLVNVGRGSIVDSAALADALRSGAIAGAALDVFEGEPVLPDVLKDVPNLVVTPHIGGYSPKSYAAYVRMITDNIDACLAGKPPITPIYF